MAMNAESVSGPENRGEDIFATDSFHRTSSQQHFARTSDWEGVRDLAICFWAQHGRTFVAAVTARWRLGLSRVAQPQTCGVHAGKASATNNNPTNPLRTVTMCCPHLIAGV